MLEQLLKERQKEQDNELINISGLTAQEINVMNKICEGYAEFLKLDRQHPCELQDFVNAVHAIQSTLAMRVMRRGYPEYWLSYKD